MNNTIRVIANWKLNGNKKKIIFFLKLLNSFLSIKSYPCEVIFVPPCVYLNNAKEIISYNHLYLGAQNSSEYIKGAYTGEVSILMLKDLGVKYVIVGHSERRIHYNEDNKIIAKKFKLIKKFGLIPILCIGENLKEKKEKKIKKICKNQIDEIITICGKSAFENSIIAYEPIWSIGSGIIADPKEIQIIHSFIKYYIEKKSNIDISKISIQYGGSVNETNIRYFLKEKDIDGVLIGGSSLDFYQFSNIISIANNL